MGVHGFQFGCLRTPTFVHRSRRPGIPSISMTKSYGVITLPLTFSDRAKIRETCEARFWNFDFLKFRFQVSGFNLDVENANSCSYTMSTPKCNGAYQSRQSHGEVTLHFRAKHENAKGDLSRHFLSYLGF